LARIVSETPDRVVVVAGPTFAEAARFTLFGMAVGAGLVYFIKKDHTPSLLGTESFVEGSPSSAPKTGAAPTSGDKSNAAGTSPLERVATVVSRVRTATIRAVELGRTVQVLVGPTVQRAVTEGVIAARETQSDLRAELDELGDRPVLPEIPPEKTTPQ